MQFGRKGSVYEIRGQAVSRNTGDSRPMLTLPLLAKMSSAALASGITACLTYGQYNVAGGPNGSGLMPPASVVHPRHIAVAIGIRKSSPPDRQFSVFELESS